MNICVFCSSSNRIDESYKQATFQLGKQLAGKGHHLVYGGATGGLMDSIAEGFVAGGGQVTGVIPKVIIKANRRSQLPTRLIEVEDMSERKKMMNGETDVFVVLPGGYGTMDEMFDVIASGTVGEHKKPLICINQDGFYDSLLAQIEYMKLHCFTPKYESYKPHFVQSIEECVELIGSLNTNQ